MLSCCLLEKWLELRSNTRNQIDNQAYQIEIAIRINTLTFCPTQSHKHKSSASKGYKKGQAVRSDMYSHAHSQRTEECAYAPHKAHGGINADLEV